MKKDKLLNSILNIVASLNIKNSLNDVIKYLSTETSILLNADRTTIYIFDKEKNTIWSLFAQGIEGETVVNLKLGKGLAGWVAKTGNIFKTDNAYKESFFDSTFDKIFNYKTKTILAMPLKNIKDELVGVIQVLNKKNNCCFDEHDVEILKIISMVGATVLDRIIIEKEIEKKDKLALIGNITSGVLHDIKNPLSAIIGFSELIRSEIQDAQIKEYTDIIVSESLKIKILLNEINDFVKGHYVMNFELSSIDDFIHSLDLDFRNLKKFVDDVNIELKLDAPAKINIDTDRLYRVIINLVKNALEALQYYKKKNKNIVVKTYQNHKNVFLEVIDNGPGINKKIKDNLFEPFITIDKIDGTGLGLSIVKKIIDNHNATIDVLTQKNRGTTFKITFKK